MKNLEFGTGTICCDTKGCGYKVENVPLVEIKDWAGKKCPKCGVVMIDEAQASRAEFVREVEELVNKLGFSKEDSAMRVVANLRVDKEGNLHVEKKDTYGVN